MPLDVMLENMRFYHKGASDLLKKLLRTRKVTPETFVEYTEMLRLVASPGRFPSRTPYR